MKTWICSATLTLACLTSMSALDLDAPPSDLPAQDELVSDDALFDQVEPQESAPDIDPEESAMLETEQGADVPVPTAIPQKPYAVTFRVTVRATYDDNIFIQQKNRTADLIGTIAPGFTVGIGDMLNRKDSFLALSYDASAFFFLDNSNLNSIDHDATLRGQWRGSKLTLGSYFNFRDLTGTNNETADRVNRKVYEAGVTAFYDWSEKLTLGSQLSASDSDYAKQLDTKELNLRLWADQQVSVLLKLGLGVTLGRVEVSKGGTQVFEQLQGRVIYAAASKVDLILEAGGELRQIENGASKATPVFSLQATYRPYELLRVHLDAYRRVQPSILEAGANTAVTGVSVNLNYRFLERFELSLGGAFERSNYESDGRDKYSARRDDYFVARTGLSYTFADNMRLGAFYQYRTNDSTQTRSSFDNQQVGVEFSYAF